MPEPKPMDIRKELARLASALDAKAEVAAAQAEVHRQAREDEDMRTEDRRAKSGRHFAEVCRQAIAELAAVRARPANPNRPESFRELLAYVRSTPDIAAWPTEDVQAWYDHFQSNGWKVSGKTPMKDWQAAVRNGFRRWRSDHPAASNGLKTSQTDSDPQGWKEWLKSNRQPYSAYRHAMDYLKTDFRKSRATQE